MAEIYREYTQASDWATEHALVREDFWTTWRTEKWEMRNRIFWASVGDPLFRQVPLKHDLKKVWTARRQKHPFRAKLQRAFVKFTHVWFPLIYITVHEITRQSEIADFTHPSVVTVPRVMLINENVARRKIPMQNLKHHAFYHLFICKAVGALPLSEKDTAFLWLLGRRKK